jgi:hypothetical protein
VVIDVGVRPISDRRPADTISSEGFINVQALLQKENVRRCQFEIVVGSMNSQVDFYSSSEAGDLNQLPAYSSLSYPEENNLF